MVSAKPALKVKNKPLLLIACAISALVIAYLLSTAIFSEHLAKFLFRISHSEKVLLGKVSSVSNLEAGEKIDQTLSTQVLLGQGEGRMIEIKNNGLPAENEKQLIKEGELVIVAPQDNFQGPDFYLVDRFRLGSIALITLIFIAGVLILGKSRGLTSLVGLASTLLILGLFVVPNILNGKDPLLITFIGSTFIILISLYLAHGFNRKTSVAALSTFLTLLISIFLVLLFTNFAKLTGQATEEAFYLNLQVGEISLSGLLLAGIIIGILGVLDDITVSQSAIVAELKHANPSLGFQELYRRGLSVGREHIASLVNTLVLAYAGASLPLFLLLVVQSNQIPIWLILNSEPLAEEIIRTLIGSLSLILAVPITTFLAARFSDKIGSKTI